MPPRPAAVAAAPAAGFVDHCLELIAPLGLPRAKRMFGGHGLYLDELFIGLLAGDELFLKVDAQTLPRFSAAGGRPFSYTARGKTMQLSFHTPPAEALDAPGLLAPWARLALEAALRTRAAAAPKATTSRRKPASRPPGAPAVTKPSASKAPGLKRLRAKPPRG